jgi:hypothetical protein
MLAFFVKNKGAPKIKGRFRPLSAWPPCPFEASASGRRRPEYEYLRHGADAKDAALRRQAISRRNLPILCN